MGLDGGAFISPLIQKSLLYKMYAIRHLNNVRTLHSHASILYMHVDNSKHNLFLHADFLPSCKWMVGMEMQLIAQSV